jgi:hypothetical protein
MSKCNENIISSVRQHLDLSLSLLRSSLPPLHSGHPAPPSVHPPLRPTLQGERARLRARAPPTLGYSDKLLPPRSPPWCDRDRCGAAELDSPAPTSSPALASRRPCPSPDTASPPAIPSLARSARHPIDGDLGASEADEGPPPAVRLADQYR